MKKRRSLEDLCEGILADDPRLDLAQKNLLWPHETNFANTRDRLRKLPVASRNINSKLMANINSKFIKL